MSQKIKDEKNRWRSRSVGFRVSPEEWDAFTEKVKLCGYAKKQDYIMECLMHHQITAKGNPLMLTEFRKELRGILAELQRMNDASEISEELFIQIGTMLEILEAFKESNGK